ncbi:MAG: PAS domain S-box protein, partial [Smithellaceae bacterium]|nr:PAS domain S-box protein [Smithellaceae bacterium]
MIAYPLLFITLTVALALMYNQQLSEEVRAEKEKYALAFQSAPYALVLSRLSDGKILEINDGFTRNTGYDEADIQEKTAMELNLWANKEDRALVVRDLQDTGVIFDRKVLLRKKSGEIVTGLFSAQLITFRHEACLLSSINDITEREKAMEELRVAQKQWQKTFDATQDAIWLMDRDLRILRSNETTRRLFVRSAEDVTGSRCWEIVHGTEAPVPECPIMRAQKSLKRESMEIAIAGKWYRATVDPILDDEGRFAGAVHTMTDISESKKSEEEIRRLNRELERKIADQTRDLRDNQTALLNLVDDLNENAQNLAMINQSLEEVNRELATFSYSVSHDLRAPLRTINGFSNALMEDYSDRLDADGRNYLERIHNATQQMNRLIDDLLGLSRVMKSDFYRQDFDLSAMVREICADLQQQAPLDRLELVIQGGITINADQRMMRIVMINLLDNARKFAGRQERPGIEFGSFVENDETVLFVRDNGVGFNMAYVQRIFEPFERLHRADEFPGTGIGLATVKRVIHRHRGRIWAEAQEGKGATFYFTLGV